MTSDYQAPFTFTGEPQKLVVDVSGELLEDKDAQMHAVMAHQCDLLRGSDCGDHPTSTGPVRPYRGAQHATDSPNAQLLPGSAACNCAVALRMGGGAREDARSGAGRRQGEEARRAIAESGFQPDSGSLPAQHGGRDRQLIDRSAVVLNIQPVIPIPLTKTWTLVPRLITPLVGIPDVTQAQWHHLGRRRLQPTDLRRRSAPRGIHRRARADDHDSHRHQRRLGSGKLSIGPSAVAL